MKKGGFVDLIMGCQWGSEYKGAGVIIATKETDYDTLISVNTANAGHTVFTKDGTKLVSRFLPTACVHNTDAQIIIGSGTNIHYETLLKEIEEFENAGIPIKNRLFIHETAGELLQKHIDTEIENKIDKRIGSTAHGVGASLVDRVNRTAPLFIDNHLEEFNFITNVAYQYLLLDSKTLLEASQGYLLSLTSTYYPFTTSRITNTSGYLSYANVNPKLLRRVYGVFRTFPIRVANRDQSKVLDNGKIISNKDKYQSKNDFIGTSGSMDGLEITWEDVAKYSGYDKLTEVTTVTKLTRRIAMFSEKSYVIALLENGITHPILTFLNYVNKNDENVTNFNNLSDKTKQFIKDIESFSSTPFYAFSTNPTTVFTK